jgi:glucosamine 6-phosphate synthetase-like amidotransferase/phosphosugar isomerase protein
MCGVIGLAYRHHRTDLGRIAGELLQTLEYRGYDSTGAAIQGPGLAVTQRKGVGAPSLMVEKLGIDQLAGSILCGQVRWATFGGVDEVNAQPHQVACRVPIYGAHNGNITNCDQLHEWLLAEGHNVRSDNDGEMVVHTVEHFFAEELALLSPEERTNQSPRRHAMRAALVQAAHRLQGSYAAVIVDPMTRCVWSVKAGSSLYFGVSQDRHSPFTIASSDLSGVLKMTHLLVPLQEGECVEHDGQQFQVIRLVPGQKGSPPPKTATERTTRDEGLLVDRKPRRSRLRAEDTALDPRFASFMEQEICAQVETSRAVVQLFAGGRPRSQRIRDALSRMAVDEALGLRGALHQLLDLNDQEERRAGIQALVDGRVFQRWLTLLPPSWREVDNQENEGCSSESSFFAELLPLARDQRDRWAIGLLEGLHEADEAADWREAVVRFVELCLQARRRGGQVYLVCCGTSFHAAKAASLFFNEIAKMHVHAVLPGDFRAEYAQSLGDGDVFMAVSQSGETKDLIDIFDDVIKSGLDVARVALVNNVNSTLAQEKSALVIPLRCGPEIAVPATKSFINQLTVFYGLALATAEARVLELSLSVGDRQRAHQELVHRREQFDQLPELLAETFATTLPSIERAADMLYLAPSLHLLATRLTAVALEGALKIREVVLNHAEGFEGSEFKHGPNTILGINTTWGPAQVQALLARLAAVTDGLASETVPTDLSLDSLRRLLQAAHHQVFAPPAEVLLSPRERELLDRHGAEGSLMHELYDDYPLIYITGPDDRDVALTISQINTHKIRGAKTVVIAEEHPALRAAATKAPTGNEAYQSVFIALPQRNDTIQAVFSATVVLQHLALKMSERKMAYLDGLAVRGHGVHPDVPKNVSKSITVD